MKPPFSPPLISTRAEFPLRLSTAEAGRTWSTTVIAADATSSGVSIFPSCSSVAGSAFPPRSRSSHQGVATLPGQSVAILTPVPLHSSRKLPAIPCTAHLDAPYTEQLANLRSPATDETKMSWPLLCRFIAGSTCLAQSHTPLTLVSKLLTKSSSLRPSIFSNLLWWHYLNLFWTSSARGATFALGRTCRCQPM
jgi:hypothetical protein